MGAWASPLQRYFSIQIFNDRPSFNVGSTQPPWKWCTGVVLVENAKCSAHVSAPFLRLPTSVRRQPQEVHHAEFCTFRFLALAVFVGLTAWPEGTFGAMPLPALRFSDATIACSGILSPEANVTALRCTKLQCRRRPSTNVLLTGVSDCWDKTATCCRLGGRLLHWGALLRPPCPRLQLRARLCPAPLDGRHRLAGLSQECTTCGWPLGVAAHARAS